jgi:hypothetical protein
MTRSDTRVASLDFWRGLALITIFVNHIPGNPLERFTHKNFGFSDAAEAFVLLAGAACALAYGGSRYERHPFHLAGRVWLRASQLYVAHLVVLLLCGAIVALAVIETDDTRILEVAQFDLFVREPLRALIGAATLSFQPAYINILPLYVVLLVASPALITLARFDTRWALAASVGLYVASQIFGLRWSGEGSAWLFNPLCWQLVFTIGLCATLHVRRHGWPAVPKPLRLAALGYVILALVWTQAAFSHSYDLWPLPRFIWDFDKENLSLPRLLHVLALAVLITGLELEPVLARLPLARLVGLLGRHALPVFCVGSVLSLAAQMARVALDSLTAPAIDLALVLTGVGSLVLLALGLEVIAQGPQKAAGAVRQAQKA